MKVSELKEFLYDFEDDVEVLVVEDGFSSVCFTISELNYCKETKTIFIVSGDEPDD